MKKLKLAYFGTPDFAADFLTRLVEDGGIPVEVTHVVTQPDRPVGRKQVLTPTSVKMRAQDFELNVIEETKDANFLSECDLVLVYAYGEIISEKLLIKPKYGFWNIHPSLLPKYRGPAPVAAALINGDVQTGVTIIQLDREMDRGPILRQEKLDILPAERRPELTARLTDLAYNLFTKCINTLINSELQSVEQDHAAATYTKLFTKENGHVVFADLVQATIGGVDSQKIFNLFRGLYPWPGLWTKVSIAGAEKRLKITDVDLMGEKLVIKKVQLEGKNEVDFSEFKRAYNFTF